MTKNPLLNALAAALYITCIVSLITLASSFFGPNHPDSVLMPFAMLSLLVLSVLVMAYCFFFTPMQLFLDGAKKEAAQLFTASIAWFAGIVVVLISAAMLLPL